MKLIDKDALVAEIERRMEDAGQYSIGAYNGMKEIRDYINSLPEEPVSEDLEEAARKYFKSLRDYCFIDSDIILAFKAGAKWQKEKDDEEKVLTYKHGFEDCIKQMIKDAVEAEIEITSKGILLPNLKVEDFDYADKVRMIIIKDDWI